MAHLKIPYFEPACSIWLGLARRGFLESACPQKICDHLNAAAPRRLVKPQLSIITRATFFKPCRPQLTGSMGVS